MPGQMLSRFTGGAFEHEGILIVLMVMLPWRWDLPIPLYPVAPPSRYRSRVSQLPYNPLTGLYRDRCYTVRSWKAKVGQFERTGALAPPPAVLLNAAQDLAAKRAGSRKDPFDENIKRIGTSLRGLRRYKHPSSEQDHLYKPDYIHLKPGVPCDKCGCDPLQ